MLCYLHIHLTSEPAHTPHSLSLALCTDATFLDSGLLEQAGGVAQFARPAFEFASPGFLANRISDTRTSQV